jgi:hypothetical protein
VAFERDIDARTFAGVLKARKTAREGGWADQWAFTLNVEMEDTIKSLLPPRGTRKSSSSRAGAKFKKRTLPF